MFNSIEFWGLIISSILAVIALIQSYQASSLSKKANENSEDANKLSQRANENSEEANNLSRYANELSKEAMKLSKETLEDSQKEYLPIIVLQDEISLVKKDFVDLCNQITFDFDEKLLYGEISEGDECVCICAKIKNIGDGFLTGIQIKEILIKSGNSITNDYRYPFSDDNDQLLYKENCNLWQHFILSKENNEIDIYFILTDAVMEYKEFDNSEEAEQYIFNFFENENITICMSLQLLSVNNSKYAQDFLMSTYKDKKVVYNSLHDLKKVTDVTSSMCQ